METKTVTISGWNKLHFAKAKIFVYRKMFVVHDRAHKNLVLISSSSTGAKISAKMPFCKAAYKIQIRTNPQRLMSAIATFNLLFFKAITFKLVQYRVSMSKATYFVLRELLACVFIFVVAGPL